MNKPELRKKYKNLRNALSASEIEEKSITIANACLQLPIWNANLYHIFLTINKLKEVQTEPLLSVLAGKDKTIVVPKSDFKTGHLTHYLLTDATPLKINQYGIPEPISGITINPIQIDVVFVPLLAFDYLGNRVGYGKGFYDTFLAACNPKTIIVGLSFFEAEPFKITVSKIDVALQYCVTPNTIYTF